VRWTLAVLFLVNVLNIYDRQALGAVLEPLRREFQLTDRQLGAIPTAFVIIYALAGVPLGRLADRWSRKAMLASGIAVWAGLTALGGWSTGYAMLFATRMGVGVGEAVCAPCATSWIAAVVPPERRSRAMAIFMMAVPVGILASFAAGGPIAQAFGWRAALALAAAPAVALVPAVLLLREPGRARKPEGAAGVSRLLRIPELWWITISGALVNFVLYAFSYFIAAFLTRYHGLSVAQAGVWSGIGSGVAGMAGALAVVAVGGRLRLAAMESLIAAPIAWVAIGLPRGNATAAVVLLMVAYGLWQMYYGPVYAAIQDLAPADLRATAMSLYFLGMYLCGGAFGPLVMGALSDHFAAIAGGDRAIGLHQAMYAMPVVSVAVAGALWVADRTRG
jgi:predicted MFS family arabinose efflux permease